MKKLLLCLAVGFATMANAQQFEVVSLQEVKTGDRETAYHPRFMPDGKTLMVCAENYDGLGLVDTDKKTYMHITDMPSAGFYPAVSEDGSTILFREKNWDDLSVSLYSVNLKSRIITPVVSGLEHINNISFVNGEAAFGQRGMAFRKRICKASYTLAAEKDVQVTTEDLKIVVYTNGIPAVLDPLSTADYDAQYFWTSLSPDKTRILFASGNLTYVCNLDGSGLVELGAFRAPVWRGNNYVVGHLDEDDGYYYTKSDIVIVKADGSKQMQTLTTGTDAITMFPTVNIAGDKIAFHTEEGKIFLMQIKEK